MSYRKDFTVPTAVSWMHPQSIKVKVIMSHTPHELAEEFPEHKDKIHDLKMNDAHFAKMVDKYHEVNRAVHRMETRIEPVTDDVEEQTRRERMVLKDQIATYLQK